MAMEMDEDFVIPPQEDEEEEEDEDESEDEVDEEESDDERQEGVLEGGVAEPLEPGKPRRNASLADIVRVFFFAVVAYAPVACGCVHYLEAKFAPEKVQNY